MSTYHSAVSNNVSTCHMPNQTSSQKNVMTCQSTKSSNVITKNAITCHSAKSNVITKECHDMMLQCYHKIISSHGTVPNQTMPFQKRHHMAQCQTKQCHHKRMLPHVTVSDQTVSSQQNAKRTSQCQIKHCHHKRMSSHFSVGPNSAITTECQIKQCHHKRMSPPSNGIIHNVITR